MGGSQLRTEFNQVGSFTQADRGSAWIPGRPENSPGIQFPGPPLIPGQMGASNQPPRPPAVISTALFFTWLGLKLIISLTVNLRLKRFIMSMCS